MKFAVAMRFFVCVLCFCLAAAVTGPAVWAQEKESARVISISGEIDGSQVALIQRGISQAEENGDKAIVVRINTQGGRVDSALRIRDILQETSIPTIAPGHITCLVGGSADCHSLPPYRHGTGQQHRRG